MTRWREVQQTVDDIISHGPEREQSRVVRTATTAALILATLIVLAVVAITHQPQHGAARPRRPAAVIVPGPVQLAGLGSGAARMLDGDRPGYLPYPLGDQAGRCRHSPPGNHDYQLASLAACH